MVYTGNIPFFNYASELIDRIVDYDGEVITWAAVLMKYMPSGKFSIYNTEDLHIKDKLAKLKPYLKHADAVYDYSVNNLKYHNGIYAPIRLFDDRRADAIACDKIYDVVFYGMITPRRKIILDSLKKSIRVCHVENTPVNRLKSFIDQSRYVISIGAYDNMNNDSFRIIPALEYNASVIAEKTNDPEFDNNICRDVIFEDYNKLVSKVLELCK